MPENTETKSTTTGVDAVLYSLVLLLWLCAPAIVVATYKAVL